jgi:hypothetical protein
LQPNHKSLSFPSGRRTRSAFAHLHLCTIFLEHLCTLCLGHLCARCLVGLCALSLVIARGSSLRPFFALNTVAHFTLDLVPWIIGSADQRWMVLPRRSRGQARTTRGVNDRPRRAIGVSRALVCCVGTPVVAHRYFSTCPGHPSCAGAYINSCTDKLMRYGVDTLPHVRMHGARGVCLWV